MKTIRINILLLLLILAGNSFGQLTYLGTPAQKLTYTTNALIKLKQDTLYVPTENGLFKKSVMSTDTLWIPAGFQGMKINDFVLIGPDSIICVVDSTEGNTVFKSINNGMSFSNVTNGFGGTGIDFLQGTRIDVNPENHHEIIAMTGSCVARSTDFCASWTPIYLDWGYSLYQPCVLRYHPLNSARMYSGGELSLFDSYLAYSFDSGTNWTMSAVESNNAVNGIAFHPTSADTIFIGKEGKITRSADGGVTWSDVFPTPNYEYIYAIVYDENNSNILYAAGAVNGVNDIVRIFRSLDGGTSWAEWVTQSFPNSDKQVISMVMYNTVLCLLTRDHNANLTGVYKLDPSTASVPEIANNKISIFPNPFSSETTLHTDKPLKNATLTIENSFGQTVKRLKHISGESVTLSRVNLPNGMYVIRLREGNEVYTGKLIITDN
ncbi:MAG: hypothetical protein K0S23_1511 [Fluviicola sp.]|jgi:hypothetical protein|uniref:T9SS type A sorting domain-containing protein n=1 Tax=Fluviicola sp. TaxID=1917219 RepID=UPI00262653D9|nr:T9SS type A sorting domain-containing protein [Fluviicola sp.]MDF3027204.1 hypothetical protein [Fluviicola sp.]